MSLERREEVVQPTDEQQLEQPSNPPAIEKTTTTTNKYRTKQQREPLPHPPSQPVRSASDPTSSPRQTSKARKQYERPKSTRTSTQAAGVPDEHYGEDASPPKRRAKQPADSSDVVAPSPSTPSRISRMRSADGTPVSVCRSNSRMDIDDLSPVRRKLDFTTPGPEIHAHAPKTVLDDLFSTETAIKATRRVARMKTNGVSSPTVSRTASFDVQELQPRMERLSSNDDDNTTKDSIQDTNGDASARLADRHMDEVDHFFASATRMNTTTSASAATPSTTGPTTANTAYRHSAPVTYARTRSYITEADPFQPTYVSEYQRRREEGLDSSDDEDDGFGPINAKIRSVHELREAGESKRFVDGVEYCLSGLEEMNTANGGKSVGRSSLMDLAAKVMIGKYMIKFRAHGYLTRFYDLVRGVEDPIMVSLITFILATLLLDQRNVEYLLREPDLVAVLSRALNIKPQQDPLLGNVRSKFEKRLCADINSLITTAPFLTSFSDPQNLTTQYLALRCLDALVTFKSTESHPSLQQQFTEYMIIPRIMTMFVDATKPMSSLLPALNSSNTPVSITNALQEHYRPDSLAHSTTLFTLRLLDFATCNPINLSSMTSDTCFLDALIKTIVWGSAVSRANKEMAGMVGNVLCEALGLLVSLTEERDGNLVERIVGEETFGVVEVVVRCALVENAFLPLRPEDDDEKMSEPTKSAELEDEKETTPEDERQDETPSSEPKKTNFDMHLLSIGLLLNLLSHTPDTTAMVLSAHGTLLTILPTLTHSHLTHHLQEPSLHTLIYTAQLGLLLGETILHLEQAERTAYMSNANKVFGGFENIVNILREFARAYGEMVGVGVGAIATAGVADVVDLFMQGIRNEKDAAKQAGSTTKGIKRKGTCKSHSRAKRRDTKQIIDRTCVSTMHSDSTTGGGPTTSTTAPSSGLLNYISYKCGICGTETRWPGVTGHQSQSSSERDIEPFQTTGQSKSDLSANTSKRSEVEDAPSKAPLKSVEAAKKKQKDKKKNDLKSLIAAKATQDRSSAGGYNLSDFLSTL
ncbi:hypothetical protein HDU85_002091 [Gaertneriomyces sp. JEL0708]|nr:hypothetical protein HDU85_002091 [Gaertneriomyces sp. JEL0708]